MRGRVHRWWRKPALQQREALRRGHQHAQRVGARLRAVLPAAHGRLAAVQRHGQAQQPVVQRLQRLGLLLHRFAGGLPGAVGHRPVEQFRGHGRPRAGRAARPRKGPEDRGHRPAHDHGRRQGRSVAAHPSRHRRRAAHGVDEVDHRQQEVRRGLLHELDEHALPREPGDAPDPQAHRVRPRGNRQGLRHLGSGAEQARRAGIPHERRREAAAVRLLRDRRQAVPHGRPAAEGERRRVHAGESRRNLLARRGPDREGAGNLHHRPVRHHAGRAHRPVRAVAAVRARRPQPGIPHGQRAEARRHAAKLQALPGARPDSQHAALPAQGQDAQAPGRAGAQGPAGLGHGVHPRGVQGYEGRRSVPDPRVVRALRQQARGAGQRHVPRRDRPEPRLRLPHLHVPDRVLGAVRRHAAAFCRVA